jgi:hypothetical protein
MKQLNRREFLSLAAAGTVVTTQLPTRAAETPADG